MSCLTDSASCNAVAITYTCYKKIQTCLVCAIELVPKDLTV